MQTLFWLTDSQWDEVKKVLEPKERKRKNKLQVVVSGIIYLLENGCKWERLPPQYGNYKSIWYYYHKWMVFGVLEKLLYTLNQKVRLRQGREKEPSLVIIDSQSVKTPAFTGEETGYDAGKKVKGRKRHLAVDTQGNVMAAGVTAASMHDKTGAVTLKEGIEDLSRVKKVIADGAYQGVPPFNAGGRIEWEIVEKKATGGRFKVLPKRWIVERTFAWLGNFRRLAKDYEKTLHMAKAMILMSAIVITLRKLSTYF
ncbi:MAG: IS5 family transposase [Flavisolibacter sp.]|nr:IS5 family transposase [Flavisolibacter sp.]